MNVVRSSDLSTFNIISAACLVLLGLVAFFYLIPMHVAVSEGVEQGLSARFMPKLSVVAILILSLTLLIGVLLRRAKGLGGIAEDNEDNEIQGFGRREVSNTVLLVVGSAIYVVGLQLAGFLIATPLALALCMWAGSFRNPIWLLALCIGFPLFLKYVLWNALYITLPVGIF